MIFYPKKYFCYNKIKDYIKDKISTQNPEIILLWCDELIEWNKYLEKSFNKALPMWINFVNSVSEYYYWIIDHTQDNWDKTKGDITWSEKETKKIWHGYKANLYKEKFLYH